MRGLECPYCDKQVSKLWEIFVLFSPFWINRRCMYCNHKVRLNPKTLTKVLLTICLCIIFRMIIDKIISFDFILFDVFLYIFFIYLPFFFGSKLFIKKE